jgi:hypothetical protein
MIQVLCWKCGEKNEFADRVPLRAECSKCGEDLHVCKCCQFWDPKVYNECREPQAELVPDRERANRCDYFQAGAEGGKASGPSKDALVAAAEALFKKKT